MLSLAERYDDLLSTILVGNNIVNIAIASVGTILFVRRFGEDLGSSLSTAVVTVVVLFFGEVTPKSLAKESPEKMAMWSAPLLRVLLVILTPVNRIFSGWKALLSRIFQVGEDRKLTQEELLLLVDEVERDGGIDSQERELVRNAIEFNDLTAEDILTPRVSIVGVEAASDRALPPSCLTPAATPACRCMRAPLTTSWACCTSKTCMPRKTAMPPCGS